MVWVKPFLSMAEADYIASRLLFQNKLNMNALNSSASAVEKHLKAFLLSKNAETMESLKKNYSHNIKKLFKKCKEIEPKFDDDELTDLIEKFSIGEHTRYMDALVEYETKRKRKYFDPGLKEIDWLFSKLVSITGLQTTALMQKYKDFGVWGEILLKDNKHFS